MVSKKTKQRTRSSRGNKEQQAVHRPPVVQYTPAVFGFPDRILTKLRYAEVYNLTSTVGSIGKQLMRWNSMFDPDQTGTGHQPLYRDTYASIYDQYAVVRARARIRFDNPNAAIPFVVGCVTDDDSTTSTTWQTLIEQSHGVSDSLTCLSGSHSSCEFNMSWDCAKVLNIDPFADLSYKTAVGANPTEISQLLLWSIPFDGISTATIQVKLDMEFDVLWTELQTPVQS